ncbi:MAG: DUF1775 domain-containing protein [Gaiellaceae bacterium]
MYRIVAAAAVAVALIVPASALAHARVSPPVAEAKQLQLFNLAVPTEKAGATSKVVLTLPSGFSIDSFVPSPGWKRTLQQKGSGNNAVIQKVTWSGGNVPTGEDASFSFLAVPSSSKTYKFGVQQTYADGSLVDWAGPESSDTPAATIETKSSLGGGGTSTLSIIALAVGAVAVVLAIVALAARRQGRPLA